MSDIELGETYSTRFQVTDATGAPGSATVTAQVTLPDGSTAAPAPTNPGLGNYDIDYTPTLQIGRYELLVTATGGVLGTQVRKRIDVFNVDAALSAALIGLDDAKRHLNIPDDDNDHDDELSRVLLVASRFVETKTRLWHRVTITETHTDPGQAMLLQQQPVISVVSVYQDGGLADPSTYMVNTDSGVVRRYGERAWTYNHAGTNVVVTYLAGETYVPPDVRHAVKVVLAHLWRTQRGNSVVGVSGPDDVWDPRYGFSYPRAVAEMLEPYAPGTVIA